MIHPRRQKRFLMIVSIKVFCYRWIFAGHEKFPQEFVKLEEYEHQKSAVSRLL